MRPGFVRTATKGKIEATPIISSRAIIKIINNNNPNAKTYHSYEISIEFYVQNAPTELVDTTVLLERLR